MCEPNSSKGIWSVQREDGWRGVKQAGERREQEHMSSGGFQAEAASAQTGERWTRRPPPQHRHACPRRGSAWPLLPGPQPARVRFPAGAPWSQRVFDTDYLLGTETHHLLSCHNLGAETS